MPSWFHGINAILAAAAVFVAVLGSIVGILATVGVIGGDKPLPEVDSIGASLVVSASPPEVMPGQEVDVLGQNLDLVSKVLLSKGLASPVPVFLIPASKTRLIIAIPNSVQPGEYNLEFRTKEGATVVTVRTLVVSTLPRTPTFTLIPTPEPKPTPTLTTPTPPPTSTLIPRTELTTAPLDSPPVTATPPRGSYSQGTAVIRGTWHWDFDLGVQQRSGADLWWDQVTSRERYLVPVNGARLRVMGIRDFESVGYEDLVRLSYSSSKINGSDALANHIPNGTVVAGITSEGRYTKFRVDEYGYNLKVSWVTYKK